MFWLIKTVFIGLSNFSGSLLTTFMSLINKPCMVRLALIDLNLV